MEKAELVEQMRSMRPEYNYLDMEMSQVELLVEDEIVLGGISHETTSWAYGQFLRRLKIPKSFYHQLDSKLKEKVIKHQRALELETLFKVRCNANDNKVTAVLERDYAEVKAEDLITLLPEWNFIETVWDFDAPLMHFRAIDTNVEIEEGTHHGFELQFSEIGGTKLAVDALIFVVVCSNGLMRTRPTGGPYFEIEMTSMQDIVFEAVAEKLGERLLQESDQLKKVIVASRESSDLNVMEAVESWLEARIPKVVPKKVMARADVEGLPTMNVYELAQMVSSVGQDTNHRTRLHFERLAGQLIGLTVTVPATSE